VASILGIKGDCELMLIIEQLPKLPGKFTFSYLFNRYSGVYKIQK